MNLRILTKNFINKSGLGKEKVTLLPVRSSYKKYFSWWLTWLNRIFNTVNKERLILLGPDLTCAEWLLRNGATVRFKEQQSFLSDYNELMVLEELQESRLYYIEEIYAENTGLSSGGFEHLQGCNHIKKITFIFCQHLDSDCLHKLRYVENTLQYLKIQSCFRVTDKALHSLMNLKNLNTLILVNLPSVKFKEECEDKLKSSLLNCKVTLT